MPMRRSSLPAAHVLHRPGALPDWVTWQYRGRMVRRQRESAQRPNQRSSYVVSESVSVLAADETRALPAAATSARPFARHDRAEFDAVFEAHYQRLVRALTVVAGDAETAADAVQEAFVKAHLRWRRISRYDDPVGWVRRVAINHLRDDHRRQGRRQRALTRLASRHAVTSELPELDEFDRLLAQLPKQQRAATALFYVDGLTVAEIAACLGIAEGSVKSHLHDARTRLKPILAREAGHPLEPGDRP